MTKIMKPSFTLGYWKPFDENTNFYESYQLYIRDTSLQEYNAQIIGRYIQSATKQTVDNINDMATRLGHKLEESNTHLRDISFGVKSLVYGMRLQIEQQKATNLLLHDIKKLMRLPDSERERIYAIELGLKFFSNAQNDKDLYTDALIEFQKAEKIMNQDYFVLHKIGLIHLLVEEHLDITKAKGYFKKAAKYASVESNNDIHSLAYLNNDHEKYEDINSNRINSNEIKVMASESYEKAAFAAYILGEIVEANELQSKAVKLNSSAQNHFFMGKYQIRGGQIESGIDHLNIAVGLLPEILDLIVTDLDLNTNIKVLEWVEEKVDTINNKIDYLLHQWKNSKSDDKSSIILTLQGALRLKYFERFGIFMQCSHKLAIYNQEEENAKEVLKLLIESIDQRNFFSLDIEEKNALVLSLKNHLKNSSAHELNQAHFNASQLILNDSKKQNEHFDRKAREQILDSEKQSQFISIILGVIFGLIPQGFDNPFVSVLIGAILLISGGIIAPKKGDGVDYFFAVCSIFYFIFFMKYWIAHQ